VTAGAQALRALARETKASAQLNEREASQAITVYAVDPKLEMIPKTTPEFHFPLHTGSKGHVLLAFSDPEVLDELLERPLAQLTTHSIVDPDELRTRLAQVRADGYAVTRQDVQLGTGSVAAPVFARDGELAGAVCLIVKVEEMTDERVAALVGGACRTARKISLQLGFRYGATARAIERWSSSGSGKRSKSRPVSA
jgi:DNA-binding IclR family transcriptional regulator